MRLKTHVYGTLSISYHFCMSPCDDQYQSRAFIVDDLYRMLLLFFQLILQRKLGRVTEDEKQEEDNREREAVVTDDSSKTSLDESRTNDEQPSNPVPEAAPKTSRAPKHEKVGREASRKSLSSVEFSTSFGDKRVGSFSSGTRSRVGSKISLSRQGSESGTKRLSQANLKVSTSFDYQHKRTSLAVYRTVSMGYETEDEGNVYYSVSRPEWGFDQIAMDSDSESDLEYFDAKGMLYWNTVLVLGCVDKADQGLIYEQGRGHTLCGYDMI